MAIQCPSVQAAVQPTQLFTRPIHEKSIIYNHPPAESFPSYYPASNLEYKIIKHTIYASLQAIPANAPQQKT